MNKITIKIDGKKYSFEHEEPTGRQLREAADLPMDAALVFEVANAPDVDIALDETFKIRDGMKFFSDRFEREVRVKVNDKEMLVPVECMGSTLRKLFTVSDDEQIIKEVKDAIDLKIIDDVEYEISKGDVFFVVPKQISNGR